MCCNNCDYIFKIGDSATFSEDDVLQCEGYQQGINDGDAVVHDINRKVSPVIRMLHTCTCMYTHVTSKMQQLYLLRDYFSTSWSSNSLPLGQITSNSITPTGHLILYFMCAQVYHCIPKPWCHYSILWMKTLTILRRVVATYYNTSWWLLKPFMQWHLKQASKQEVGITPIASVTPHGEG